ncbi:MAG: hypothetical protein R6X11_09915, partial [Desulfonatronovibrio sp.]
VDMEAAAAESGSPRQRVVTALEYFHEQGWIMLRASGSTDFFQIISRNFDQQEMTEKLYSLFKNPGFRTAAGLSIRLCSGMGQRKNA